jgi:hypothetical protein
MYLENKFRIESFLRIVAIGHSSPSQKILSILILVIIIAFKEVALLLHLPLCSMLHSATGETV